MAAWQDPQTFAIWLAIFLIVVVGLVTFIVFFVQAYYKKVMQNQQKLALTKLEYQKTLLRDSVLIQEQERQRVAMELHDGVISKLNTILLAVNFNYDELNVPDALQECIHLTRRLSHDLSPPLLEQNTTYELLFSVIMPLQVNYNVTFYPLLHHVMSIPDTNSKLQVIRIAQEVINNIMKHAKANTIEVKFRHTQHSLAMSITDDGVGFDVLEQAQGLGLKNIELRVQLLKGKYKFHSIPGKGTTFIVGISLPGTNPTHSNNLAKHIEKELLEDALSASDEFNYPTNSTTSV
ncbi:MAG TPA: hypothetical protein DCS93_21740 [Microscillaceae bacterium]|nr:hypothetical protein [Microscillaceae bacterium]